MTGAGLKILKISEKNGRAESVRVDMGEPEITGVGETVMANGRTFIFTRVSMGNPHAVIFQDEVEDFDVAGFGTVIEHDALFPNRTNAEFAKILIKVTRDQGKKYIYEALQNDLDENGKLSFNNNIHVKNDFTAAFMKTLGFEWRRPDEEYMKGYIKYYRDLGYLSV